MRIAFINGSPRGKYSATNQTAIYISKKYPENEYKTLNAGTLVKVLEKDFTRARELLEWAELVVFCYPVYTFMAPSQLHRFIELIKSNGISLRGKWATTISTSKHFYDTTARRYLEDNIADLGMHYVTGLSADMEDLLSESGRCEAEKFFEYVMFCIKEGIDETRRIAPRPEFVSTLATVPSTDTKKKEGDVLILTNIKEEDSSLALMIERFKRVIDRPTRLININECRLDGGCIGCFSCAVSGKCIYKDGFDTLLRETIQTAGAIVYAFEISDHSMGSRFKMYDDRNFCNGHRTVTVGMPVGYLISGDFVAEENLATVIEARAAVGHNYLAGIATDEHSPDTEIDNLAKRISYALDNKYVPPKTFWGVGGMKIFRDLIYQMRGMMRADHKFYKENGYYNDFPQNKWPQSLAMYLVGFLLSSETIRKKMGNKMNEGMIAPYKALFKKLFPPER